MTEAAGQTVRTRNEQDPAILRISATRMADGWRFTVTNETTGRTASHHTGLDTRIGRGLNAMATTAAQHGL